MKVEDKIESIRLRRLGKSYNEIREQIRVSKSTLSLWLRSIRLTKDQVNRLKDKQRNGTGGKGNREKRIKRTEEIITSAKKEAGNLLKDSLFVAGLMLYWAEGSDDLLERVKLSNSDPAIIRFMMNWFRKYCNVSESRFRIGLHIHEIHCRKDVEKYWSRLTGIPQNQFHKTLVKLTTLKYRKNPLYNGTCNIIVSDKDLFRRMRGWKMKFIEKLKLTSRNDYMPL